MRHHLPPVGGAMGRTRPEMELVGEPLLTQDLAEVVVIGQKRVGFPYCEDNLHASQCHKQARILKLRDEMAGGVEIDRFVVVTVEEIAKVTDRRRQVIATAEGHDFLEAPGVAEGEVDRVVGAEATAMDDQIRVGVTFSESGTTSSRI